MGRPKFGRALGLGLAGALCLGATPPASGIIAQLPNLDPRPARSIRIGLGDPGTPGLVLRFGTTTRNTGAFPFELLGAPPRPDLQRTAAQQCIAWAARACVARQEVGDFIFHPEHGHWHLEGYALYELRRLDPARNPIMTPDGLASSGGKVSFCLIDVEPATDDPQPHIGPLYPENPPLYLTCQGVVQGISAGWADTYGFNLQGQQIPLAGVDDDDYAIVITVDPDRKLLETTRQDNVSFQRVQVYDNGTRVRLLT